MSERKMSDSSSAMTSFHSTPAEAAFVAFPEFLYIDSDLLAGHVQFVASSSN